MTRALRWCGAVLSVTLLCGCAAESGPDAATRSAVDNTVREYISLRNAGNLTGLLAKSCEDLYTSTSNILALSEGRQKPIVDSMREHPVQVWSVDIRDAENFRFDAEMTGSAETPSGWRTATQKVRVRHYRQGYRVCRMEP